MSSDTSNLISRLASQVIAHARQHELGAGAHVTEQSLADTFHVSRSPIRKALSLLARQGVLTRESNRGYFIKTLPVGNSSALKKSTDEAEESYLRIADDRLGGRIEDHVTETELMRRYGFAHRELQRILHRMEKEGWVERKAGHGWHFLALADTAEAHAEGYRFRMLIEPAALLESRFRIVRSELERIRRDQCMLLDGGVYRLSRAKLFEMGSDFHETLIGFSGNRIMTDAIKRVNATRRLLEYRGHYDRERFVGQCREHLHLLDLVEHGSREEAARYLRKHLDVVRALKTEAPGREPRAHSQLVAQL